MYHQVPFVDMQQEVLRSPRHFVDVPTFEPFRHAAPYWPAHPVFTYRGLQYGPATDMRVYTSSGSFDLRQFRHETKTAGDG